MTLYLEALRHFTKIYREVQKKCFVEPTSMIVASADKSGRPSARVVLLKSFDERGFVFFTNHNSRKGRELQENPFAALVFYWDPLDYQIRIEGAVEKVSDQEADSYWETRARDSQIGAWASLQSQSLANRRTFLKRIAQIAWKYKGQKIPRPPHWSGFRLVPDRFEFWTKKLFRLHERQIYERKGKRWQTHLLYP